MRKFISLLFSFFALVSYAQESGGNEVSLGYFGPLGEPGFDLGLHKPVHIAAYKFDWNPQIAFWAKNKDNTNIFLNSEFGIDLKKPERKRGSIFSIGIGYIAQFEVTSFSVNFQGDVINKDRERRDILMPTINYEFNHRISDNLRWFAKFSYGYRISSKIENMGSLMGGLGVKYSFSYKAETPKLPTDE
jgi:hypothetical protein